MATLPSIFNRNKEEAFSPARAAIKVTAAATDLPDGVCRALWVGTAGTITGVDAMGNTVTSFPASTGLIPVGFSRITTSSTASDIWALY